MLTLHQTLNISYIVMSHLRTRKLTTEIWSYLNFGNRLIIISWDVFINQNANIAKTRSTEKDHVT